MLTAELIEKLTQQQITLAVAESLTGGLVMAELIAIPGASRVVLGGVVAYSEQSKHQVLGVSASELAQYGAVSSQTALAMAEAVRVKFESSIGVATTGVAGPDLQDGKPIGTTYIAVATPAGSYCEAFAFAGDRSAIRQQAVTAAIGLLGKYSGIQ